MKVFLKIRILLHSFGVIFFSWKKKLTCCDTYSLKSFERNSLVKPKTDHAEAPSGRVFVLNDRTSLEKKLREWVKIFVIALYLPIVGISPLR